MCEMCIESLFSNAASISDSAALNDEIINGDVAGSNCNII
jgi:hypothetical protein